MTRPSNRTLIVIGVTVALLVAIAAVALWALDREGGPTVTSAWPKATSERSVPRPPAPLVWPLTGLPAPSADAVAVRPLSVKIENSSQARPQTGLNEADVVYESIAEGGITRFNAIFHSKTPEVVGPVRSARLSDLWIVPQYHAIFFFSGASYRVNREVRRAGLPNMSEDAGVSKPYYRSSSRSAPHNLYLKLPEGRRDAAARGIKTTWKPRYLNFSKSTESTIAVSSVTIPLSDANTTSWRWDAGSGVYLRSTNGRTHTDAETGEQLSAKNVVVMWAVHTPASRDVAGSTTYDIQLGGSGRASVFRDGVRVDGTWEATRDAPPVLRAQDGTIIRLAPGRTWFEVVPMPVNIRME